MWCAVATVQTNEDRSEEKRMKKTLAKQRRYWVVQLSGGGEQEKDIAYPFPNEAAARKFATSSRERGRSASVINRFGRKVG